MTIERGWQDIETAPKQTRILGVWGGWIEMAEFKHGIWWRGSPDSFATRPPAKWQPLPDPPAEGP